MVARAEFIDHLPIAAIEKRSNRPLPLQDHGAAALPDGFVDVDQKTGRRLRKEVFLRHSQCLIARGTVRLDIKYGEGASGKRWCLLRPGLKPDRTNNTDVRGATNCPPNEVC